MCDAPQKLFCDNSINFILQILKVVVRTKSTKYAQKTAFPLILSQRLLSWVFSVDLSLKIALKLANTATFFNFWPKFMNFWQKNLRCLFQQRLDFISENGNANGHCQFWQSTRLPFISNVLSKSLAEVPSNGRGMAGLTGESLVPPRWPYFPARKEIKLSHLFMKVSSLILGKMSFAFALPPNSPV